jgi:hypothetical protein
MVGSAIAALAIGYNRRFGWIVGVGVVSWLLYAMQETVGLPGLSRTWWADPADVIGVRRAVRGCCSP